MEKKFVISEVEVIAIIGAIATISYHSTSENPSIVTLSLEEQEFESFTERFGKTYATKEERHIDSEFI